MSCGPKLSEGIPPDWAGGWGFDGHGLFIDFSVPVDGLTDADHSALKETQQNSGMSVDCNLRFRWHQESGNWVASKLTENIIAGIRSRLAHITVEGNTVGVSDSDQPLL